MTRFVKVQTVVVLSDLLEVQLPVRWILRRSSGSFSWAEEKLALQSSLLAAAQTVVDWRQGDDSPDGVADFARQVANCAEGPNWALHGAGCTLVVTVEPDHE